VRAPRIVLRPHRRVEFGDRAPPSSQFKLPARHAPSLPGRYKIFIPNGLGSRLAAGFRGTGPICDTGGISGGQQWYAREMMRIAVTEGTIAEVTVYCTGDWDQARQAEHAAAVTLIRP
jgi:hypothetical protein